MPIDIDPFPAFFFDSNSCFGEIDSVERWRWMIETLQMELFEGHRDKAVQFALDATCMKDPSRRSWSREDPNDPAIKLGMALEGWGEIANFGYRSEHVGGETTLGEWLRVKGWLDRLTSKRPTTITGRITSGAPNLQNIPIRLEIEDNND